MAQTVLWVIATRGAEHHPPLERPCGRGGDRHSHQTNIGMGFPVKVVFSVYMRILGSERLKAVLRPVATTVPADKSCRGRGVKGPKTISADWRLAALAALVFRSALDAEQRGRDMTGNERRGISAKIPASTTSLLNALTDNPRELAIAGAFFTREPLYAVGPFGS